MSPPPLFKHMAIIGPGLIGSSLLRRAKEYGGLAESCTAIDHNPDVIARISELGLADQATTRLEDGVREADLVILCVPTGSVDEVARSVLPFMAEGSILSDVASVRGNLNEIIERLLPPSITYVPAHPMAGTEFSGPDAGFATLFETRWCLLTPSSACPAGSVEKMVEFWKCCGAQTKQVTADYHDHICAMVSHLPHLLAFTICDTADHLSADLRADVLEYAASGFRDFTRIAASDPVMWRDIFLANRDILLQTLARFQQQIDHMAEAIRLGDNAAITDRIARGRRIRKTLLDKGQA